MIKQVSTCLCFATLKESPSHCAHNRQHAKAKTFSLTTKDCVDTNCKPVWKRPSGLSLSMNPESQADVTCISTFSTWNLSPPFSSILPTPLADVWHVWNQCRIACTLLSAGGTQRSTQFGRPTLPFLSTLSQVIQGWQPVLKACAACACSFWRERVEMPIYICPRSKRSCPEAVQVC